MKRSWLVLLSVFVVAVPLAAAQVAERVNVSLIEVPVTVVDGSGNAVRGLKAEHCELSADHAPPNCIVPPPLGRADGTSWSPQPAGDLVKVQESTRCFW